METDERSGAEPQSIVVPAFSKARAVGGTAILGVAGILMFIDSQRTDYALDSVQLGLLLTTSLLLLGIEGIRKVLGP